MKRGTILRTVIASALVLAIVLLAAAAPLLVFRVEDAVLFSAPLARRRLDSRLSPAGSDNYLVRTLHTRAETARKNGSAGYEAAEVDMGEGIETAVDYIAQMIDLGVLPPEYGQALTEQLFNGELEFSCEVDFAGVYLYQFAFKDTTSSFTSVGMEVEPLAGKVIRFWCGTTLSLEEIGYDVAMLMETYRTWLGLDDFADWTDTPGYYVATQISQAAQLELFVQYAGNSFMLGVAALGAEELPGTT